MLDEISKWKKEIVEFRSWVNTNPVMWFESDFDGHGTKASFENLFTFLSGVKADENGLKYARSRYEKLRKKSNDILPADLSEFNIIGMLLKTAISSFIIRDALSTIASCGMIGEIMTKFLFQVWNETIQKQPLTEDNQKRLFGGTFVKQFQKRRINILCELEIIDSSTKSFFDTVNVIRNDYLHIKKDLTNVDNDAEKIWEHTNKMLEYTFQIKIENKKIWINKHISDHLINQKK